MRALRTASGLWVLGFALVLAGCVPSPELADIQVSPSDVQGGVVEITIDQAVYIDTSDLGADVESYAAEIADESIVEFLPGRNAGDFATYPGFAALKVGSTEVTVTGAADAPPLEFTVRVIDRDG